MIDEFLLQYPVAKKSQYVPEEPFVKCLKKQVTAVELLPVPVPVTENKPLPVFEAKRNVVDPFAPPDFFNTLRIESLLFQINQLELDHKTGVPRPVRPPLLPTRPGTSPPSPSVVRLHPAPRLPPAPPPPPEMKPLSNAEEENLRNRLISDIKNVIWVLRFESGPRNQGRIH